MNLEQFKNGLQADIATIRLEIEAVNARLTEARETQGTVLREVLREDRAELRIRKETLEGVLQELKDVEV